MRYAQRAVTGRDLDELIALLDEGRETRGDARCPELALSMSDLSMGVLSMGVLRDEAFRGGAGERASGLIHAPETGLALHEMPIGSHALP